MAGRKSRAVTLAVAMAAAVALLTLTVPGAQASHRVTKAYTGSHDPFLHALLWWSTGLESRVMCAHPTDALGAGGACFYVPSSAQTVAVEIDDASDLPVTGGIAFRDIRGRPVGSSQAFCDHTEVAVPRGADRAIVTADAYAIECGIPATGGTVAATFR